MIIFGLFLAWVFAYVAQEPSQDEFGNYNVAIANMETIGNQLSQLVGFLKEEQRKVAESEATLRRLTDERTQLEPVVLAQRDTVNAILSAHARNTAARAWKERLLGFIMGLIASLLASIVFEYLRR